MHLHWIEKHCNLSKRNFTYVTFKKGRHQTLRINLFHLHNLHHIKTKTKQNITHKKANKNTNLLKVFAPYYKWCSAFLFSVTKNKTQKIQQCSEKQQSALLR